MGYFDTLNRRPICYLDPENPIDYFNTPNGVHITVLYLFENHSPAVGEFKCNATSAYGTWSS